MSEPVDEILQFFSYTHLPPELAVISQPFCELATFIVERTPRNAERTFALRQLMLSKDAAVRAYLAKPVPWRDRASGPVL